MALEPELTRWQFPPVDGADEHGIVGIGADLKPGTLLAAYRHGIFPMPIDEDREVAWWSPDPRGVLMLSDLHVSRSLRRSLRRYDVTIDRSFDEVISACAKLDRDGGWISPSIISSYTELHRLGWAHSVEVWEDEALVGGLYGVQIGGLFAGESMFHTRTDASKVALVRLVELLRAGNTSLLDVQWATPHLMTLGVTEIPRSRYLRLLAEAIANPFARQISHHEDK